MALNGVTLLLLLLWMTPFSKGNSCPAEGDVLVSFSEETVVVRVYDKSVQLTLLLSNVIECCPVSVLLKCVDINATSGTDYECGLNGYTKAIFSSNSTKTSFNISIMENNITEGIKKFNVKIVPQSLQYNVDVGDNHTTTVNINDIPSLSFSKSAYIVGEDQGTLNLTLVLSNPLPDREIEVNIYDCTDRYPPFPNVAEKGIDYDHDTGLTLDSGMTNDSVHIYIYDNDTQAFERNETFAICIRREMLMNQIVTFVEPTTAIITIVDNEDNITVHFDKPVYSTTALPVVLILSHSVPCPVTIYISDQNITAKELSQLEGENGISSLVVCPVTITNRTGIFDNTTCKIHANDNQFFELYIVEVLLPYGFGLKDPSKTIVGYPPSICEVSPILIIAEENKRVKIGTSVCVCDGYNITIDCAIVSGTPPITITWLLNGMYIDEDTNSITVADAEDGDVVVCRANNSIGSDEESTTINVKGVVEFSKSVYTVKENQRLLQPVLFLNVPLSTNITVQIFSENINTTGYDYICGTYNVTFNAGNTNASFNVPIHDDQETEYNEIFDLHINRTQLLSLSPCLDVTEDYSVSVIIFDDDCVVVNFSKPMYTVNENQTALQLVLNLSKRLSFNITVQIFNEDNTTISNDYGTGDYASGPYNVTFTAGSTHASFDVYIYDDHKPEYNKTFYLHVNSSSSLSPCLNVNSTVSVTIIDDDGNICGKVYFRNKTYRIMENETMLQPILLLSKPLSINITVHIHLTEANGYGNGMADFASQSNMYNATFSAGSTSASFDVFICNDNVPEGNEDFILSIEMMRLASLSPCLNVDFSEGRNQSKVTIVDDDTCPMYFKTPCQGCKITEGGYVYLQLIHNIAFFGATARIAFIYRNYSTSYDDYSNHTRSGLFSVGQTKYTLCIKTNDDSILENNEIFSVVAVASSPTAKHFITCNATANVTIQDNDKITVKFNRYSYYYYWYYYKNPVLQLNSTASFNITVEILKDMRHFEYATFQPGNKSCVLSETIDEGLHILTINKSSLPNHVSAVDPYSVITWKLQ